MSCSVSHFPISTSYVTRTATRGWCRRSIGHCNTGLPARTLARATRKGPWGEQSHDEEPFRAGVFELLPPRGSKLSILDVQ